MVIEDNHPVTVLGRSCASVEAISRRRLARAYRSGKQKAPDPLPEAARKVTDAEYREFLARKEAERDNIIAKDQLRWKRLLFLFKGRREMILRQFEGSHRIITFTSADEERSAYEKRRERVGGGEPEFLATGPACDLENFTPYVFSFELWLMEERCGWRERSLKTAFCPRRREPLHDFAHAFRWWLELSPQEQLQEMLVSREKN